MADASYYQTSFLGGEISQWAQGQSDKPYYKISLNKASNIWITDEGVATRRPGTRHLGTTRFGKPGRVMPLDFTAAAPYSLEFTDGWLRMWNDTRLVTTNDSQIVTHITNTSPAVFNVANAVTWPTGDFATFSFSSPSLAAAGSVLLNRQFVLTMLTPNTFTVTDSITNVAINGADLIASFSGTFIEDGTLSNAPISDASLSATPTLKTLLNTLSPTVNHISQIATPYTEAVNDWHALRLVQGYNLAFLLHASVAPRALQVLTTPSSTKDGTFAFAKAFFQDGPYLDPPTSSVAVPSSTSAVIQLTVGYNPWSSSLVYGFGVPVTFSSTDYISIASNNVNHSPASSPAFWTALPSGSMINDGQGFQPTDVGRMVRLFSEPEIWDLAKTYASGDKVTYNGTYFSSLANSNTNNQPDISLTQWVIDTSAAVWTWGFIIQYLQQNSVQVQIQGAPLLYAVPVRTYRLGAWSDTTGWPTCGCYQEGRFWFSGAIPNRFDSSQPNQPFNMAPTAQDGTVGDNNAITYTLNSEEQNPIFWMQPDHQGILAGTQEAEWLISAGTAGPMSPSNIQAHRQTKYGSSNIAPARTGLTICFVKRYARRVIEYLADILSGRFYGPELTTNARHLGARGIEEVAYQEELVPTLWSRCADGSLIGTTYRRISLLSTQGPEFNAWHQHSLGSERLIESICTGPSVGGTLDALMAVTNDPNINLRYVEQMTTLQDETQPLTTSWFLDGAVTPPAAAVVGNNVQFRGLHHLNGRQISIFAAGIDCGDYVVENGIVNVPLGTKCPITGMVFDTPQFAVLQNKLNQFTNLAVGIVYPTSAVYYIPCVIGFNYQSQGQLCRPQVQQDSGARNGPAFGKKRKSHHYAVQVVNSLGTRFGTDLTKTKPAPFNKIDAGGKTLKYLDMFSGVIRESLDESPSYDSMLAWTTTRPYPTTVTALGGFIDTTDI